VKTKFLKTYNFILSIIISLLEFSLLDLFKTRNKNSFVLDYGAPPLKYQKISKTYFRSFENNQVQVNKPTITKSQNNINDLYKIINDNLNSYEEEICLSFEEYSIQTENNERLKREELSNPHSDFTQEGYKDNSYEEEVIRK
jgi:hypothetical protein